MTFSRRVSCGQPFRLADTAFPLDAVLAISRSAAIAIAALFLCMLIAVPAAAQITDAPQQGWPGIVPGSNDYTYENTIVYDVPSDACYSFENSFVPAFGHQVYGVISYTKVTDVTDPATGVPAPTYRCRMDGGDNGVRDMLVLYGCTESTILVEGACVSDTTPVSAEQDCSGPTRWNCPTVGDPVSVATGAKVETVTDYASGGPVPLEIKRSYRSMLMPLSGVKDGMGLAWRLNLAGRRMKVVTRRDTVIIRREDGMQRYFSRKATNQYAESEYVQYSLQESAGSHWNNYTQTDRLHYRAGEFFAYEYEDESGRVDRFESRDIGNWNYQLVRSTWKNGYWQEYSYETGISNKLTGIVDSFGRALTFQWTGDLITSIGLPDGNRIDYAYTPLVVNETPVAGSEVLTQVSRFDPAGQLLDTKGYEYDRTSPSTQVPLLTGMYDAKGIKVDTTTYDPTGRVLVAEGPGGANRVELSYDDFYETLYYRTVTNALGQSTRYTFMRDRTNMGGGQYTALTAPRLIKLERLATNTVPAAEKDFATHLHNPGGVNDWNGNVSQTTNEVINSATYRMAPVQKVEDVNGVQRISTMVWDPVTYDLLQVVTPKLTTNYTYDAERRVIRREEVDTTGRKEVARAWEYTYNTLGQLEAVSGPRTDVSQLTTYTYDAGGNLASVTNALGHTTTVNEVDVGGRPLSITDENGVVTSMTYDPLGRAKSVTIEGPIPATTLFAYDVNGQLTTTTSAEGVVINYAYDDAQRLIEVADSAGNAIMYELDAAGNKVQTQIVGVANEVLMANRSVYDTLGRLLSSIGAAGQATSYSYDGNGNPLEQIDPRSAISSNAFDGLNRLVQTVDPLGGMTAMAYNDRDSLTSVTDARNNSTTYEVNGFGFVTQTISPDSGTTLYTHDLAGNVLTSKDARRVTTTYTYDALDRPLTRSYSSDASENVTFSYDDPTPGVHGIGRLTSVTDQAGTATFTYDAYGNRTGRTRTIEGIVHSTSYYYDLDGNVARTVHPHGLIVNYFRDAAGEVSEISVQESEGSQPRVIVANGEYMPFGPITAYTLGNGVQISMSYDLDYRLTGVTAAGTAIVQDLALVYGPSGNIASIADGVDPALTQTFDYDLLNRVTRGTGIYGEDTYAYDALGNRLSRTVVNGDTSSSSYSYDPASNKLLSASIDGAGRSYTHDASGARTQLKIGSGKKAQVTDYAYNAAQRLATAGGTSFRYNAFGERLMQVTPGGNTHFVFDEGGALLGEYNGQGATIRSFIYLNGLPIAMIDAGGAIHYVLNDHLGQPQKMLDGSGNVTWHRANAIYGETIIQIAGDAHDNPLRFPGQQADPFANLNYNYLRTYDPDTGRYLETDPLGLLGGLNLYNYADANPVQYVDPTGEYGILGALVGGGSDLAFQTLIEGKSLSCVDWTEVGLAAGLGAVTGGTGNALKLGRAWQRANRSMKWENARRRYRRAQNVDRSQDVHHWFFPNRSKISGSIKNHPLNFNPIPRTVHQRLHQSGNPLRKWWDGWPGWAKAASGAPLAGAAADAGKSECGCQ